MKGFFSKAIAIFLGLTSICFAANTSTFILRSSSFQNQGILSKLYTCDGKDISPAFDWSGAPTKTKTFALIFADLDAPGSLFYHWILYNIPKTIMNFPENVAVPSGINTLKNSWGKSQYNGPCPPKGETHYYAVTLYALDAELALPASADANALLEAMQNHILEKVELGVSYGRS